MHQLKQAKHRTILNGVATEHRRLDVVGFSPAQHNTVTEVETVGVDNHGLCMGITLNDCSGKNALVSFSVTISAPVAASYPAAFARTVVSSSVPSVITNATDSAPLIAQMSKMTANETYMTIEGTVLVPILARDEEEYQFVYVGIYFTTVGENPPDALIAGQVTQYESEYSYIQPCK